MKCPHGGCDCFLLALSLAEERVKKLLKPDGDRERWGTDVSDYNAPVEDALSAISSLKSEEKKHECNAACPLLCGIELPKPTKPERCCDKAFVWSGGEGTSHMCCNVHCCVPKSSE